MGYAVGGTCHADLSSALWSVCTGPTYPYTWQTSTAAYVLACTGVDPGLSRLTISRTAVGATNSVVSYVPLSFAACDESQTYGDLRSLFLLGLAAVAVIAAARRALAPLLHWHAPQ